MEHEEEFDVGLITNSKKYMILSMVSLLALIFQCWTQWENLADYSEETEESKEFTLPGRNFRNALLFIAK